MNRAIQPESSNAPQVLPLKRRRGRPRKDQSLNLVGVARAPPGFQGVKVNKSQKTDKVDDKDGMVGQAVTGVIEASFDAGYVRIANSHPILWGVVFKPGHYVPVTSENDIAPHVQMIQRSDVSLPLHDQRQSFSLSRERNDLHGSSPQLANMVESKGKSASPTAGPLFSPASARGTVVPVVLQPLSAADGPAPDNQVIQDASSSKDRNVATVEPLAMLPPDKSASSGQFQVATNQQLLVQVQTNNQVPVESVPIENGSHNEGASVVGQLEEAQIVKPTNAVTPGDLITGLKGFSQSLETHFASDKSSGTSHTDSDQDMGNIQLPFQQWGYFLD